MHMFILLIIVILIIYYLDTTSVSYVKSDIDNNTYIIRRSNKSKQFLKKSANTLAEINKRILDLIIHLKKTYYNDEYKGYFIKILEKKYSHKILSEASVDSRYTTFTVNKNDMHICIRTRDENESVYDINLLLYVILHELAHLVNYDKDGTPIDGVESHGTQFRYIFKFLVEEAIKIGIYTYKDYSKYPENYCGITLNTSII